MRNIKLNIRNILKKNALIRTVVVIWRILKNKYSFFKKIKLLIIFFKDYSKYKKINKNNNFKFRFVNLFPCIYDKTKKTPIGVIYFYQDTWCARKVFENIPKHHYDIGSKVEMVGIISQFVPTTMIDIRPISLKLDNLYFKKGDILALPFKDKEIESLSSICVLEHIGLGRYGDRLDSHGSEKAIEEIKRVIAPGGNIYISVPIDNENKIYFNAHRAFTRDYVLKLFQPFKLIEEKYIYGANMHDKYDPAKGFGTGLYYFKNI